MLNFFNTSPEVSQSNVDTAVLALGSVEPKGPHLPVGLDLKLANRFARDFCAGKAVYLLPSFPFSTAVEARGFKGAASLTQQTMWEVLFDIAGILARYRFKRFIVFDFSNYNCWIVKHAVREINLNRQVIQTVWVNPREFAKEAADSQLLPDHGGGAIDTSLALALEPKMVRDLPGDFDAGVPREYIDYGGIASVAPDGYWGNPSKASAEKGQALYKEMLEKTAEYLDWALNVFPDGKPLETDDRKELWWPHGGIPGADGPGLDWKNTISEIAAGGADIAVIGTSSTEQHSPCIPIGADYLACLEFARGVADKLGAYLLPAIPVITAWGHIHFRGTVTFCAMTVRRILEDIVESLYEGGFRRAVIVNVHGGNWVVKPTMIELNHRLPDMTIVTTGDILAYRGQVAVEELHAGDSDGSFVKGYYPEAFK
ncbi:MAG: creatininase family protein, partial [Planctomycetota bacterium]